MRRVEILCGWMLLAVPVLAAEDESRGLILYERFLGSSNTLGNFLRLDTTVGYSFNKYFSIDGGLPVFFVRPSETTTASAVPQIVQPKRHPQPHTPVPRHKPPA